MNGNTGGVNLYVRGICHHGTLTIALDSSCTVTAHSVGAEEVSVSVTAGCDNNGIGTEALQLTCYKVFGNDTTGTAVNNNHVFHLITSEELNLASLYFLRKAGVSTKQQLLLGAYGALSREIARGTVKLHARCEMMDLVVVDGRARGIIVRNLATGDLERYAAHAVVLGTGGYGNLYYLSTNAMNSNGSAAWVCHRKGAAFANPCYVQIHPTCIPVHGDYQSKLTLMSESLRNDGRIWVPKRKEDAEAIRAGKLKANDIAEENRDYYLERRYPAFGNLVPRDVASRAAKERCDAGYGVGTGYAVYLDFADAIQRLGKEAVEQKYGNLFQMYQKITDENPYETPMMIYPAIHYTMGGLWVDYELQTTIPGLFAAGEANFSDHGANRLGASALMQGLADGYFVLPYTLQNYLADQINVGKISTTSPEFDTAETAVRQRINKLLQIGAEKSLNSQLSTLNSTDHYHKALGKIMWEYCGMARNTESLTKAKQLVSELENEFWKSVFIPGTANEMNPELEKAYRLEDYFELAQLVIDDAMHREESCGGHFRTEHQTDDGETLRDDERFMYVAAWEYQGHGHPETMEKEPLVYEHIQIAKRNYK